MLDREEPMKSLRTPCRALAFGAVALALVGCRSLSSYHFGPSPQAHELALEGQVTPIARVQISALGFAEASSGGLIELRFRLRIENPATPGLRLRRECFQLVDGRLASFGAPAFQTVPGDEIAAGGTVVVDVAFPLPHRQKPGDVDLTGLVLTWGVMTGEQDYVTTARFEELYYYYPCGCGYAHGGRYGYYHGGYGYTYPYRY
jgi:hypothetical protein